MIQLAYILQALILLAYIRSYFIVDSKSELLLEQSCEVLLPTLTRVALTVSDGNVGFASQEVDEELLNRLQFELSFRILLEGLGHDGFRDRVLLNYGNTLTVLVFLLHSQSERVLVGRGPEDVYKVDTVGAHFSTVIPIDASGDGIARCPV